MIMNTHTAWLISFAAPVLRHAFVSSTLARSQIQTFDGKETREINIENYPWNLISITISKTILEFNLDLMIENYSWI